MEEMTERMSSPMKRLFGIQRRVPDTTLRDARTSNVVELSFEGSTSARQQLPLMVGLVVRRRWGVETSHQILDIAFAEDDHPWIEAQPRAALVVAILPRISYTLLSLFRSVTQRSQERRTIPWKRLMRDVLFALVTTTRQQLDGLRRHYIATLC